MASQIYDSRTGRRKTLLNPAEKGKKFAFELKQNKHFTNDGEVKRNKKGSEKRLSDTQKAYRSGYLDARKDNAKCFNSKNRKGGQVIIYRG